MAPTDPDANGVERWVGFEPVRRRPPEYWLTRLPGERIAEAVRLTYARFGMTPETAPPMERVVRIGSLTEPSTEQIGAVCQRLGLGSRSGG